jgi:hypothetical protein
MAVRDHTSPRTLAFHRAIARRIDAGAKIDGVGPYTANARQGANGQFILDVGRRYTADPGLHAILALQLLDEQIALLQISRKAVERAFLKQVDRHQLGAEVRPAVVSTGNSTRAELAYMKELKRLGYREAAPDARGTGSK